MRYIGYSSSSCKGAADEESNLSRSPDIKERVVIKVSNYITNHKKTLRKKERRKEKGSSFTDIIN